MKLFYEYQKREYLDNITMKKPTVNWKSFLITCLLKTILFITCLSGTCFLSLSDIEWEVNPIKFAVSSVGLVTNMEVVLCKLLSQLFEDISIIMSAIHLLVCVPANVSAVIIMHDELLLVFHHVLAGILAVTDFFLCIWARKMDVKPPIQLLENNRDA